MFGRVITAMATPFHPDGSLDLDGAARLAGHLAAHGSEGLVVSGTTGESATLSVEEKRDLFGAVVEAVSGRARVIAGTGSYDTAASIRLSRIAADQGADGLLLVAPYYTRPPQRGLRDHFRAIAAATDLPVLLYDVPSRTSCKIEHETLLDLAGVPNIIGLKDAAKDLPGTARLMAEKPAEFTIWSGDDALTLPMLALGARGAVSVASHLAGPRIAEMIQAHEKGDIEGAAAINRELTPLFEVLFITSSPIPLKAALAMVGLPAGPLRLPLVEATEEERTRIHRVLDRLGLL